MNKKLFFGIFNFILMIMCFACLFIINLKLELFNLAYLFIVFIILFFVTLILYLSKNVLIYNCNQFFVMLVNCVLLFLIYTMVTEYNYSLNNNFSDVGIFVLKNNKYNNIDKLNNKNIGIYVGNNDNVVNYIEKNVSENYYIYNDLNVMLDDINKGNIQSFVMDVSSFDLLDEMNSNKTDMYRKIYNVKIRNNDVL